ncbi:MAG: hypothetical protein AAF702_44595 [Chloroflexota bacterium]
MQLELDVVISECAIASDSRAWVGRSVFFLTPSCLSWNIAWLTERQVSSLESVERMNAKGKKIGQELHVRIRTGVGSAPLIVDEKRRKRMFSQADALAAIDEILVGNKFVGDRAGYEAIRERIAEAEDPVIFG